MYHESSPKKTKKTKKKKKKNPEKLNGTQKLVGEDLEGNTCDFRLERGFLDEAKDITTWKIHWFDHVATVERVGERTVTAMYTSKDDLTPLLYSGKIKKKKEKEKYIDL